LLNNSQSTKNTEFFPPQIDSLKEVVDALEGSGVEVLLDGGVRKGTDVFKALALGAKAVLVGRPILWGLAYAGQQGVELALGMLNKEFASAMALAGN
jgi:(S)-2-hydroxy-acid oxidase